MSFWIGFLPTIGGSVILTALCAFVLNQCRESVASPTLSMGILSSMLLSAAPVASNFGVPLVTGLLWLLGAVVAVPVAIILHRAIRGRKALLEEGDVLAAVGKIPDDLDDYSPAELKLKELDRMRRRLDQHTAELRSVVQRPIGAGHQQAGAR